MSKATSSIDIVAKQPEHDEAVVALRAKVYPQMAPVSLDLFRHWQTMDHVHPQSLMERYSVLQGEALVGSATVERLWALERPGAYAAEIRIDPTLRGQGPAARSTISSTNGSFAWRLSEHTAACWRTTSIRWVSPPAAATRLLATPTAPPSWRFRG